MGKITIIQKCLALEDFLGFTEEEIKNHISSSYEVDRAMLDNINIILAYESVGSWGCDSSSTFVISDKEGNLFEVIGSHCSCNGFEGKWEPKPITVNYSCLKA